MAVIRLPAQLADPTATPTGVERVVASMPDAFLTTAGAPPPSRPTTSPVVLPRRVTAQLPSSDAGRCRRCGLRVVAVAATPTAVGAVTRSTVEDINAQRLIRMAVEAAQAEPAEARRTTVDRAA